MRIVSIVGARPQFIKVASVARAVEAEGLTSLIVHTGQHYDDNMSRVFFDEMEIPPPQRNLGIGSGPHGRQTGEMLTAIEAALVEIEPDWVVVYGDTNSTLAGALAASKLHLPIAHVEAGLRSYNRAMPEEINRVVTDHISDLLLVPTRAAISNLANEGIRGERVVDVGDVMFEAALYYGDKALKNSSVLSRIGVETKGYVLATIHRAENTDVLERLEAIIEGLFAVAQKTPVVLPLHPRTRAALERAAMLKQVLDRLLVIDPVGYLDMVMLERRAKTIVTDSGGVQKEAYFHGVPCVTLRDETEWVELIEVGANVLVPPTSATVIHRAIERAGDTAAPSLENAPLYGGGKAPALIVEALLTHHSAGLT